VALAVQELSKEKKKIDIVVGAATSRISGMSEPAIARTLGISRADVDRSLDEAANEMFTQVWIEQLLA
jgi:DNA-binding transcriptional regulator LsrR (DeoR family)